jgi:DNA glycosylase AlkZ-like
LRAQLLVPSAAATTAFEVVERAIIQAQDARAARLGIRARSKGLTEQDVERERVEDRSFVRAWAMRGTIHLVSSEDYGWIRDLVGPPFIPQSHKRMAQEGMTPAMAERARPIVWRLLEDGPVTRAAMRDALARKGIEPAGRQALVHLLYVMTYEGEIVTGPYVGGKETMVRLGDWLPGKKPRPPKDPAAELARRYLRGYGPATIDDFRWWSSLRAADARAGWTALGKELVEEGPGLVRLRSQRTAGSVGAPVKLLPMWDHYFLGYRDRTHVGPPAVTGGIVRGGMFEPLVVADGKAVGMWKLQRRAGGFDVEVRPLGRLPAKSAIQREVDDLSRFLGAEVSLGG